MAQRQSKNWFDTLLAFVAANPRMSAAIAFEIGVLAAGAAMNAKKSFRAYQRNGVSAASKTIIRSLPDVASLNSLKSLVGPAPAKPKRKSAKRKAKAKRVARKANGLTAEATAH